VPGDVNTWFDWVPPGEGDPPRYAAVRASCLQLARTLVQYCPDSAERTLGLYKLREVWFFANEALQRKG
jgi:hypothetical protein